ncbi:MAG: CAP domain-containing protein [Anaerocolumna sp.]
MKKNLITSMLTVTVLSMSLLFGNITPLGINHTAVASAATSITSTTPKLSLSSRTSTSVTLKTYSKVKVTGYSVYRTSSSSGKYKYIGSTKSRTYVDKKVKSTGTYYYKVRAYAYVNGVKKLSKATSRVYAAPIKSDSGSSDTTTSSYANQVLKIVNEERSNAGLSALSMSDSLVAPANKRAKEIKDTFSHTRPDGTSWSTVLDDYNVSVSTSGENIAYGYNTAEKVMEAWMNSSGHRANILGTKYNNIGIGVYEVNGTIYCTQLFSN